ncbi:hypothetical protein PENSPDRAFT_693073 [Peniophora sp. CONT]|nr:hypothetical protein PENSPDRAFT_693073 [Peniophora sp. CONT]
MSTLPEHLSSAQWSRAGAKAVRMALAQDRRWEAFHLWHSMRWSLPQYGESTTPFKPPTDKFKPVDFGRAVSPVLAGHSLVHGLLRSGERRLAGLLAQQMVEDGVKLKPQTVEAILSSLQSAPMGPASQPPHNFTIPTFNNVQPRDPLTAAAVVLLRGASKQRGQRTRAILDKVISVCLAQTEILVASLLLGMLIAAYQQHGTHVVSDVIPVPRKKSYRIPSGRTKAHIDPSRVAWSSKSMEAIVQAIEPHIRAGPEDEMFEECSQSLAFLAHAVDARRMPLNRTTALIKLLYSYPNCDSLVWVERDSGAPDRIRAYTYFNDVLLRLIEGLPAQLAIASSAPTAWWDPLRIQEYNSLLHYAIHERRSIPLMRCVLEHVREVRKSAIEPNNVTHSITLRGLRLARRNDLAEQTLGEILGRPEKKDVSTSREQNVDPRPASRAGHKRGLHTSSVVETDDLPESPLRMVMRDNLEATMQYSAASEPVQMDPDMLVQYILHIIETGRPEDVAPLFFELFPELNIEDREERGAARQHAVDRAVQYGPDFFSAVVSAMQKAGKTGMAERVWGLAKAAEQASWTVTPWVLPVHAYTTMIAIYHRESRRPDTNPFDSNGEDSNDARAMGFGRYVPQDTLQQVRDSAYHRAVVGRIMAFAMYEEFMTISSREDLPLSAPKPDARFFKVALRLLDMDRSSNDFWRHQYDVATRAFLAYGELPEGWTPELQRIAEDMDVAGYALPLAYRSLLVGRWNPKVRQEEVEIAGRRPFVFPPLPQNQHSALSPGTAKTKGLPVRSMKPRAPPRKPRREHA